MNRLLSTLYTFLVREVDAYHVVSQPFTHGQHQHCIAKIPHGFDLTQEGLRRQQNQLDAYVAWHRRLNQAPTLEELMSLPSTNERWAQDGKSGALAGAPKVTVILNLFKREVWRLDTFNTLPHPCAPSS